MAQSRQPRRQQPGIPATLPDVTCLGRLCWRETLVRTELGAVEPASTGVRGAFPAGSTLKPCYPNLGIGWRLFAKFSFCRMDRRNLIAFRCRSFQIGPVCGTRCFPAFQPVSTAHDPGISRGFQARPIKKTSPTILPATIVMANLIDFSIFHTAIPSLKRMPTSRAWMAAQTTM